MAVTTANVADTAHRVVRNIHSCGMRANSRK
jgi:hypothetical protein